MQRLTLLVAVLLLQLVIACGDGGTQTPTTPPTPANRAPAASAAIPDQSVEEGTQAAVNVAGAFSDPDGDALRYEATSDASSVATASVSGSDVTVTGEAPGSATDHGDRHRPRRPQRHPDLRGHRHERQPGTGSVGRNPGPERGRGNAGDGRRFRGFPPIPTRTP